MKIGITGTHSTGKTTLVESLRTEKFFKDYFFDINVTRWVKEIGLPINEHTNDASQEVNLTKRIAHLNSFDNIVCDRTIIDNLAYSSLGKHITPRSLEYQNKLVVANIFKYDFIFYLPMDIDVVDDGVRMIDPIFRSEIDHFIQNFIERVKKEHPHNDKFHTVRGSVRERIQQVLDIII